MRRETNHFDIAVLGGGPGGYPAAIRAAQLGLSVALIEAKQLGGTCLNRGCIPTKALIANADVLKHVRSAEAFGVQVKGIAIDYGRMASRKNQVVNKMRKGLESLIASNKITVFRGFGKLTGPHEIKVLGADATVIHANRMILATGSEPRTITAFPCDGKRIHDSTTILELDSLPASLVIIGGGVIGCEFASLYAALGVQVTVLELMPTLLPMISDAKLVATLAEAFRKQGIAIKTGVNVQKVAATNSGVQVTLAAGKPIEAELALVAVGRSRNTRAIGLEKAGVVVAENGAIPTNDKMETNVPGIYAVGDITGNWWLAHVATHQGLVAANNAAGVSMRMHYNAVPSVIFTDPEIATVGMSLEEAKKAGYQATEGTYPFEALGKSQAAGHPYGYARVVTDAKTGQVLGAQAVGYESATLIAEMGIAIANELTVECILDTIHAHPTIAEGWLEAALLAHETPLHYPPSKKPRGKAPELSTHA